MSQTIFLKIGERNRVPLRDFIGVLNNFLNLLRDVDSTVANDKLGSVVWEVVSLRQNSPPVVGVSPTVRHDKQDFSPVVATQVLDNIERLNRGGEPTKFMSYSGLSQIERLADKTRTMGNHEIFTEKNGQPPRHAIIAEPTLQRVKQLTGVSYIGYGSVSGKLEAIYVHKASEFRVWDEASGKAVRCKLDPNQEDKVKSLLRHRVRVSGSVSSNAAGIPIAVSEVEDVEDVEALAGTLPTIHAMSGLVADFTDGKSLKEYLEDVADE
jgi:hypothetical protein